MQTETQTRGHSHPETHSHTQTETDIESLRYTTRRHRKAHTFFMLVPSHRCACKDTPCFSKCVAQRAPGDESVLHFLLQLSLVQLLHQDRYAGRRRACHLGGGVRVVQRLFPWNVVTVVGMDRIAPTVAVRCQAHAVAPCLSFAIRSSFQCRRRHWFLVRCVAPNFSELRHIWNPRTLDAPEATQAGRRSDGVDALVTEVSTTTILQFRHHTRTERVTSVRSFLRDLSSGGASSRRVPP